MHMLYSSRMSFFAKFMSAIIRKVSNKCSKNIQHYGLKVKQLYVILQQVKDLQ